MTKILMKNIITKFHFFFLGFVLLNFILKNVIEISLNYEFAYFINVLVYASGIILFIWNFKPYKKIATYFSFYMITTIFTLLFWLFGGIFFALLASILFYPIYPNSTEFENENIIIHKKYQGFMSTCCTYELNAKKYWILEKKLTEIDLNKKIDFKSVPINSNNGKTELKLKHEKYDYKAEHFIMTDTIILIRTE